MKQIISDKEFERQLREARKKYVSEPEAMAVRYENGRVSVELASGWNFNFDPRGFEEFASATEADLETIGLWGQYTLACPALELKKLNYHYSILAFSENWMRRFVKKHQL